ncbi:hypothetical protein SAMN04488003_10826 [Loktanella fryxellensis]|uniref:DUF4148 domain-containing protein n=1 Tax=Loktanella fryxellensis TaxID=245187 RepID=A0A1H8D8D6_9RHOB|nr:hypothetical protein [Loktanella fryxellensis]SEN02737.1 hypothetical protein SAMN04488003_10826 [Loktanella fryxellensis]
MFRPLTAFTAAALTIAALAAGPVTAQTNTLIPMDVADTSAASRADFDANLSALGVRVDAGEQFTASEIEDAKRVMNDQSSASLKASRIENIVNGDGTFMSMGD